MSVQAFTNNSTTLTQSQYDAVLQLLAFGKTLRQASDATGASYTTARRIQAGELQRPESPEGYAIPPKAPICR